MVTDSSFTLVFIRAPCLPFSQVAIELLYEYYKHKSGYHHVPPLLFYQFISGHKRLLPRYWMRKVHPHSIEKERNEVELARKSWNNQINLDLFKLFETQKDQLCVFFSIFIPSTQIVSPVKNEEWQTYNSKKIIPVQVQWKQMNNCLELMCTVTTAFFEKKIWQCFLLCCLGYRVATQHYRGSTRI